MELGPKTKIEKLLQAYPFLEDFLTDYHPAFEKLKNPFMRKTVGKFATVAMAAGMAGISEQKLLRDIEAAIDEQGIVPRDLPDDREVLKGIIKDLHGGKPRDEIQQRFNALADRLDATEIAAIEQELMEEGMPETEIRGLCDVHARMMGEAMGEEETQPLEAGHPAHTMKAENHALELAAAQLEKEIDDLGDPADAGRLAARKAAITDVLERVGQLEIHYQRKENQLFPYLEKKGITGPPQVMWGVHDDIRGMLKNARQALTAGDAVALKWAAREFIHNFREMVFKEEKILIPMCLQALTPAEWWEIKQGEPDIGYALIEPGDEWRPPAPDARKPAADEAVPLAARKLPLDTGMLTLPQVNLLLTHLPVDITFVDENDEVRYYSEGPERIFPRSPGVIGRKVQNCHPPKSLHMVENILETFRAGKQDVAEFWIEMEGKFLYIRYFAMRDPLGKYRGCLEMMQDATRVRSLEGERRLLQWESKA